MSANQILRALPPDELNAVQAHTTQTELRQHDVLYEPDELIDQIYFVESGMASLLVLTRDGLPIETGVVGAEGIVGSGVCIDSGRSLSQVVVQLPGTALRMPTKLFLNAYVSHSKLRSLINKHLGYLYLQSQQNAACHALHSIDARLARWLLEAQDVIDDTTLNLTQEFLSHMLGVQRPSVSVCAHSLQAAGLIRYRRGKIEVKDRVGLEECACECYEVTKRHREMLTVA